MSSSVDAANLALFSDHAGGWWQVDGPHAPLHRAAPERNGYFARAVASRFDRDLDEANPLEGLRILDVGCGGGLVAEPLARLGADVTGIDADPTAISVAEEHAEAEGVSVTYRCATAEELVEEGMQYDAVIASEVVEHVTDPASFCASLARLTRPGGLVAMSTFNRTIRSYMLGILMAERVLKWVPKGAHDHAKFLKPSELAAHLRIGGLETSDVTGLIYDPLKRRFRLSKTDLAVNYLLTAHKD